MPCTGPSLRDFSEAPKVTVAMREGYTCAEPCARNAEDKPLEDTITVLQWQGPFLKANLKSGNPLYVSLIVTCSPISGGTKIST